MPPTPVNCEQLAKSVGLKGFGYAQAVRIWSDGNLSSVANGATIAALAAVTWQGEDSSFSLTPKNNVNKNGSVDYGPFQINQRLHANPNTAVWGTNGGGRPFNGDADANISFGIELLEGFYKNYGKNPNAQKREATWKRLRRQPHGAIR